MNFSLYCRRCGHSQLLQVADNEEVLPHVPCGLCRNDITVPYFSDGQLRAMLTAMIFAGILFIIFILWVANQ